MKQTTDKNFDIPFLTTQPN